VHGGALPQRFFGGGRVFNAFLRAVLQLPDVVVVLAQVELEAYRRFVPGQQVLAIPNGIDCTPYARIPRMRPEATAPLRLLYIGRLAKGKGLCELLQALKLAHAQAAKARLVIAGSGPEEGRLRHLVDELGLASDVSFVGPVFGDSKVRLLADSDALVLASYSEGLPYALLESMAAGAPAVVTPVGAIPDVVTDSVHGLLVPPRDPAAIFRAIGKLDSDRDALARMGAACRKRISTGYSVERLSGEFFRLYSQLCAAKHMKPLTRP
jgi:glycosyltransferase involved in cell wall biosynthesis